MGEWYDYDVYLPKKKDSIKNIRDLLVNDGYITFTEKEVEERDENGNIQIKLKMMPYLEIDKIDSKIAELKNDSNFLSLKRCYTRDRIGIGLSDHPYHSEEDLPCLHYCNKWAPNDLIFAALSIIYPEEIFGVYETSTYWFEGDYSFYIKNDSFTNINGEEVTPLVFRHTQNFKEYDETRYKISLPLGDGADKWGTIIIPKINVSECKNEVWFPKNELVTIIFKYSPPKTMAPEDLRTLYREKRAQFSEQMNREFVLNDLSSEDIIRRTDPYNSNNCYYIVKIPVPVDISENGYASACIPNYCVNTTQNTVTIGRVGDYKNIMVVKDGESQRIEMKIKDIEESYNNSMRLYNHQPITQTTEQTEEDFSIDL